jgi:actin related protein 2/3 complex subunit 2
VTTEKFLSLSSAFERGETLGIIRKVRVLGGSDDAEEEEQHAEFGYDATVEVDLNKLNEAEEKEEMIDLISSVRVYAGYGTLRACLRRLVVEEEEEEEEAKAKRRSFSLRRQFASPSVSMYCKVEEDDTLKEGAEERRSCTVVFPMHVSSSLSNNEDEVVIARAFLAHFAEASRNSAKLSAAPFVSYHKPGQKPPLELTTSVDATTRDGDEVDEMDLNANGGYVSFVIFPRHVKTKESLERAVWMLASFPNFIKSHLKCSKGYWHEKMRGKAEELLETLKRAQKEPKMSAKKKLISGRTYVPR